jgi:hypothetical protein
MRERAGNEDLFAVDADQRHCRSHLLSHPSPTSGNARAFAREYLMAERRPTSVFG